MSRYAGTSEKRELLIGDLHDVLPPPLVALRVDAEACGVPTRTLPSPPTHQPYWDCRCILCCRLHLRFAFFGFQILDGMGSNYGVRTYHYCTARTPPQRDIRSPGCRSRRAGDGFGFLNEALRRCIKRTGR
jgi:hypothetical protein